MRKHECTRGVGCSAIFLLATGRAVGQMTGSGTIQGTITDSSGAVVPQANVTAINVATGVQTTRPTTGAGLYVLSPLPAGEYNRSEERRVGKECRSRWS